jgi:hypothetical protein
MKAAYIHYDRKKRRREERGGQDQANRDKPPIHPNFCRSFFLRDLPYYVSDTPRSHALIRCGPRLDPLLRVTMTVSPMVGASGDYSTFHEQTT